MQGGAGGRSPPQDSIPTHIWDIGLGFGLFGIQVWDLGYLGYRFGIGLFGI